MPIFDMKCPKCETVENDVLLRDPDDEHKCQCGEKMEKLPSMFGFTMTPGSISKFKRKVGNTLPPEYKTSGGANIYGVPRKS